MAGQFTRPECPGLLHLGDAGTEDLPEKHTSVQALRKSLEKAWNEIQQHHVRAAVEACPERLKAVIRTKGGHIE
ncbi:hypothetical protein Y032_0109g131 [Ancylostoma ceylanicum]|uniref:Uncharacterized protein n=1 Tax=Ancylostoma ceylanicum TaxID=53326 RepID=A0A016TEZ3_9BILA|nr:hypothetical protein Y032_0109g131 [Ancylostoma ceylanicum]